MSDVVSRDPTLTGKENYQGPNSPDLDASAQAHMPAFTDVGQVVQLVRALKYENREREIKNARILAKYNAERPYRPEELSADGLSWKQNFSTKPLATLIDKVSPRFTTALRNMRYLTASKLPDRFADASKKTEVFRREVTQTCRSREGWDELMSEVTLENSLFGYTAVGWLDRFSWFPKQFKQECFLVPEGTKHTAKSAPIICLKETYLLHELFDLVRNPEAAKSVGWDVEEVISSINNAVPTNKRSGFSEPWRIYADLAREASVMTTFTGAKAVEVWHVFVSEIDGAVTHVAFDATSEKQLFHSAKQFERMADVSAFYSFQHGNGKIHGSKGIGRELYAMAGVLDRARNEVVDRLQLSGKLVLQCDERDLKRFRMSVVGNAILIANGYNVQSQKVDGNIDAFFKLDQFLTDLLDTIAGSTSPKVFEGERVTKAAVELYAARDEERRDAIIERFLTQYSRMMSTVQRRLCDPKTSEVDAKEMQARLLEVMSPEELGYLAAQPAVETVSDYSDLERQQISLIVQEANGNPLYNQRELHKRKLTAQVDAEFAEAVLLPENDPTEQAEQTRQQQLEMELLEQGSPVPVSPRDNHDVHCDVLRQVVSSLVQAGMQPGQEAVLGTIAQHIEQHIATAEQMGMAQQMAEHKQFLSSLQSTLQQLQKVAMQAEQVSQGAPSAPPAQAAPGGGVEAPLGGSDASQGVPATGGPPLI